MSLEKRKLNSDTHWFLQRLPYPSQPLLKSTSLLRYKEEAFFSTSGDMISWLSQSDVWDWSLPSCKLPIDQLSWLVSESHDWSANQSRHSVISSLQNHFCVLFFFVFFFFLLYFLGISLVSNLFANYFKGPLTAEGVMKYFSARYLVIRVWYSWCGCIQGMYTDMHSCERNNIILECLSADTYRLSLRHAFYGLILPDGFSKPLLCVRNSIFITNPGSLSGWVHTVGNLAVW